MLIQYQYDWPNAPERIRKGVSDKNEASRLINKSEQERKSDKYHRKAILILDSFKNVATKKGSETRQVSNHWQDFNIING